MRKVSWMMMAVLPLALSGCAKDLGGTTVPSAGKIMIETSIVEPSVQKTPALSGDGSGNFADGDVFALYVASPADAMNRFDYRVGSTTLYWKDLQLQPEDRTVTFAACYPKQEAIDGTFTFDLESASDQDLLWARTPDVAVETKTPIDLTFKHAMHRLAVNFTVDPAVTLAEVTTVCTAKSTCEVDLVGGTLNATASRKASFTQTGEQVVFLLVPQPTAEVSLQVTAGELVKTFTLDELAAGHDSLESGKQLTVNMNISKGSIELNGTTIEGWGDQGTVDGEIIL